MFKSGQLARVKTIEEIQKTLGDGHCLRTDTYFNSEGMEKYCGKVITIDTAEPSRGGYKTFLARGDEEREFWCWSQEWLEIVESLPEDLFKL